MDTFTLGTHVLPHLQYDHSKTQGGSLAPRQYLVVAQSLGEASAQKTTQSADLLLDRGQLLISFVTEVGPYWTFFGGGGHTQQCSCIGSMLRFYS